MTRSRSLVNRAMIEIRRKNLYVTLKARFDWGKDSHFCNAGNETSPLTGLLVSAAIGPD